MPFDFSEISDEVRRNPRPYVALALLAIVVLGGGLAYRRTGRARDHASLAKAEAELRARGLLLASDERDNAVCMGCAISKGFIVAWVKPERGIAPVFSGAKSFGLLGEPPTQYQQPILHVALHLLNTALEQPLLLGRYIGLIEKDRLFDGVIQI